MEVSEVIVCRRTCSMTEPFALVWPTLMAVHTVHLCRSVEIMAATAGMYSAIAVTHYVSVPTLDLYFDD